MEKRMKQMSEYDYAIKTFELILSDMELANQMLEKIGIKPWKNELTKYDAQLKSAIKKLEE